MILTAVITGSVPSIGAIESTNAPIPIYAQDKFGRLDVSSQVGEVVSWETANDAPPKASIALTELWAQRVEAMPKSISFAVAFQTARDSNNRLSISSGMLMLMEHARS